MNTFAYIMAGLFVLAWIVLLVKLIAVVSSGRKKSDKDEDGE